jgi:ankyrin repeat protein
MKTSWEFETSSDRCGVDLRGDTLSWWGEPHGPMGRFSGGGSSQSLGDFVKYGPDGGGSVPQEILREMLDELCAGARPRWLDPPDAAVDAWIDAAYAGDATKIEAALAQGVDVNARDLTDRTALFSACARGHREVAALLLECGAEVDPANRHGLTPLMMATCVRDEALVTKLLEHGADATLTDREGETALHRAHDAAVTDRLLAAGADPDAATSHGKTPLHAAAKYGRPDVVARLIAAGARVEARDSEGWTPLRWAHFSKSEPAVRLLLAAGALEDATPR